MPCICLLCINAWSCSLLVHGIVNLRRQAPWKLRRHATLGGPIWIQSPTGIQIQMMSVEKMRIKHELERIRARRCLPECKVVGTATIKTAFYDPVVRDHLLFMSEIPCTDHSLHKSLCGERLPAERDQRPADFA